MQAVEQPAISACLLMLFDSVVKNPDIVSKIFKVGISAKVSKAAF